MYDVVIIGGGPAGLAAAVYAARKRLNTRLITGDIGGQVNRTLGIENYLGYQFVEGAELITRFQTQVAQYPIEQELDAKVSRVDRIEGGFRTELESGARHESRAVIFAAGKRPRELNVPGEREFAGKGVTYCAVCDGPIFAGKRVAVIGGGNSAFEAVLDLVKIAEHVDLVSLTKCTCDAILEEKAKEAANLDYYLGHDTIRIEGNSFVDGIVIKDIRTGQDRRLAVEGVFVEIGLIPNSDAVKHLVKLNEQGEVPIDCNSQTEVPGLFAAGDVTDVPEKQIIIAAGEGAKALLQAHKYLQRLAR